MASLSPVLTAPKDEPSQTTSFGFELRCGDSVAVFQVRNTLATLGISPILGIFRKRDFNAFDISFSQLCNTIISQPNGKLLAVGSIYYNASKKYSIGLARFNVDGMNDSSFGTDGLVSTLSDSIALGVTGVAMDSNGKIVVVGNTNNNFMLSRYSADLKLGVLNFSAKDISAYAYPNPLRAGNITLGYELLKPEAISIDLINEEGKQVFSFMKNNYRNAGKQKEILQIPSTLPLGTYLLNISSLNGNFRVKIMKCE